MTCLCHCFRMLRTALQAKPGEPLVPYVSRVTKNDTRSGAILGQYHFVSKAGLFVLARLCSFCIRHLHRAPQDPATLARAGFAGQDGAPSRAPWEAHPRGARLKLRSHLA